MKSEKQNKANTLLPDVEENSMEHLLCPYPALLKNILYLGKCFVGYLAGLENIKIRHLIKFVICIECFLVSLVYWNTIKSVTSDTFMHNLVKISLKDFRVNFDKVLNFFACRNVLYEPFSLNMKKYTTFRHIFVFI